MAYPIHRVIQQFIQVPGVEILTGSVATDVNGYARLEISFDKEPWVFAFSKDADIVDVTFEKTGETITAIVFNAKKRTFNVSKTTASGYVLTDNKTGDADGRYTVDSDGYVHHDHSLPTQSVTFIGDVSINVSMTGVQTTVYYIIVKK